MSNSEGPGRVASSILDLKLCSRLAVATGHFVNDITACMWFSYFLLYIQEVAGLDPKLGGILMLIGQVVDAISTPAVGHFADKQWGRNGFGFGRLKTWHFFGVLLAAISFPFIFSPPLGYIGKDNDFLKAAYYFPFILVYEFSWAAVQISHLAIIPKMTPDMLTRTEILSMRYALMVISNVFVFVFAWFSVGKSADCTIDKQDVPVFQHLAYAAMGVGLLTSVIFYICTTEYSDQVVKDAVAIWEQNQDPEDRRLLSISRSNSYGALANEEESREARRVAPPNFFTARARRLSTRYLNPGRSSGEQMTSKDWIKSVQLYMVAIIYIPGRLTINVPQAFLPLYLVHSLSLPCSEIAIIPLIYFISGFFCSTTMKWMAKWLGKQISYLIGIILNVVGASLIFFIDSETMKAYGIFYVVFVFLGGGAAVGMVSGLSITADMIGNNVESSAFVYGFMSFCDKMSCGLGIALISMLSPTNPEHFASFYTSVMAWSCFGCSIIGIVGLILITIFIYTKTHFGRSSCNDTV